MDNIRIIFGDCSYGEIDERLIRKILDEYIRQNNGNVKYELKIIKFIKGEDSDKKEKE